MNFYDKTNLILRLDQMIRLRFRGNADSLSRRLGVSRSTFFRLLDDMKSLDAPIEYNETGQFYYYEKIGRFRFGFYKQEHRRDIPFDSPLRNWKQKDP
jgi:predicted DNA-binding transcriptional regulator YafY